jgi:ubiquinone/menaquinone biosynthesis C-methylase UbiE
MLCEPDRDMRRRLRHRSGAIERPHVSLSEASAESLPFSAERFDAVVSTLVLCSVAHPGRALAEVKRVLRPDGRLVFLEHVAAQDDAVRLTWQRRVEPVWKRLAGNCHLTRDTERAFLEAGFEIEAIERESIRNVMPLARPSIRGTARKP